MADPTQAAAPGLAAPVVPAAAGVGEPGGARRFASVAAVFFENRLAIIGLVVVVAMFAFCFLLGPGTRSAPTTPATTSSAGSWPAGRRR